ncbi:TPA: hypothetical protein ACF0RY_004857, partial [Escherichia coli]
THLAACPLLLGKIKEPIRHVLPTAIHELPQGIPFLQFLATAVEAPPTNNVVKIIILTNADLRI